MANAAIVSTIASLLEVGESSPRAGWASKRDKYGDKGFARSRCPVIHFRKCFDRHRKCGTLHEEPQARFTRVSNEPIKPRKRWSRKLHPRGLRVHSLITRAPRVVVPLDNWKKFRSRLRANIEISFYDGWKLLKKIKMHPISMSAPGSFYFEITRETIDEASGVVFD